MTSGAPIKESLTELVALLLEEGCVGGQCVAAVLDRELSRAQQRALLIEMLVEGLEALKEPQK